MALILPKHEDPMLVTPNPGLRLICVSGGPCTSLGTEMQSGVLDRTGPQVGSEAKAFVAEKAIDGLPQFLDTVSNYGTRVPVNRVPTIYHDGRTKSKWTYDICKQRRLQKFNDGMHQSTDKRDIVPLSFDVRCVADAPQLVWTHIMTWHMPKHEIDQVVLFCSVNTMYRILRSLKLITDTARILIASGGYLVINIPHNALPSFNVGAGPWGWQSMVWGTATQTEHAAFATLKTREIAQRSNRLCPLLAADGQAEKKWCGDQEEPEDK